MSHISGKLTTLSAELAAIYNDQPDLHRIDAMTLAAIEAKGGTFDFETGKVSYKQPTSGIFAAIPIVGAIDSATGRITFNRNGE